MYRIRRHRRTRSDLRAVTVLAWAGLVVLTLSLFFGAAMSAAAGAQGEGGQHREPEGCVKYEFPPGQQTFTIPFTGEWTIKAGTLVETFTFDEGLVIAATNSKDISHVIGCPLSPPPTYPTVPPSTTTVQPSTTTVVPPSTTAPPSTTSTTPPLTPPCQEDEPCWDCETMGNRQCGPVEVPPSAPPVPVPSPPSFTG